MRNRHAFSLDRVTEALSALRDYEAVREAAIVSTCNRLEIYADVVDFEVGVAQLRDFLTTYRNMRVDDFDKYLYTLLGAQAVEQLFRVASGLDSMLLGEAEIIGQVRAAHEAASRADSVGPQLNRLFNAAVHTGKRARTETAIGRDVVSFGSAAVELAARNCDLKSADAVVVGAGKIGASVARHLAARGAARITIVNRSAARAQRLAAEIGGRALGAQSLLDALHGADLLISATGSQFYLLSAAQLKSARKGRFRRPLLIVDMAVPGDVDPGVAAIPRVRRYELDDLNQVIHDNLEVRKAAIPAVESIIAAGVRDFMRWYQSRAAVPLIASLRRKAEDIRSAEMAKLLVKLPDLSERERHSIVAASVAIINKLLHAPVTRLRETAADGAETTPEYRTLERLFDLAGLEEQVHRQLGGKLRAPAELRARR